MPLSMFTLGNLMSRWRVTRVTCLLLLSRALLALSSSGDGRVVPASPGWPPDKYKLSELTITLERSECYGTCPIYSVAIRGDGSGTYRGEKYVAIKGKERFQVSRDELL